MSKYGISSGPNIGKYGPEKTSYLDTFQAVKVRNKLNALIKIALYLSHNQRQLIYSSFFTRQLSYCPLIWKSSYKQIPGASS